MAASFNGTSQLAVHLLVGHAGTFGTTVVAEVSGLYEKGEHIIATGYGDHIVLALFGVHPQLFPAYGAQDVSLEPLEVHVNVRTQLFEGLR
jgi:hypothetical protein